MRKFIVQFWRNSLNDQFIPQIHLMNNNAPNQLRRISIELTVQSSMISFQSRTSDSISGSVRPSVGLLVRQSVIRFFESLNSGQKAI